MPEPREAITYMRLFQVSTAIFIVVVILLVTHAKTGMSAALIGVVAALLTVFTAGRNSMHIINRVDWRTLVFFIGLFVCVGGLEVTGFLKRVAGYIGGIAGGEVSVILPVILWLSANSIGHS